MGYIGCACRRAGFVMIGLCVLSCASFARDIGFADDPLQIGVGARPMGMGKAFVAIADDENSIFINPAGLSRIKDWTFTSMYTSFLGDVNYVALGLSYPFSFYGEGGSGIGYLSTNVPDIISPGQSGFSYSNYFSNVLLLSTSIAPYSNLAFGTTLKFYSQSFSGGIESIGNGVDLDLGAKWDFDRQTTLGISFQNILPASLGGNIVWPNGDEQRIPPLADVGIKCQSEDGRIIAAYDCDMQLERRLPGTMHLGVEWKTHPQLSLRVGADQNINAASGGAFANLTFGLGFDVGSFKIDYAYHPYYEETGNITHYISMSFSGLQFVHEQEKISMQETVVVSAEVAPNPAAPVTEEAKVSTPETIAVTAEVFQTPVKPAPAAVKKTSQVIYEVQAGDTLKKIAIKFYKGKDQSVLSKYILHIAHYNNLNTINVHAGQKLKIPPVERKILKPKTDIKIKKDQKK